MKKKILLIVGAITAFVLSAVGILKYKNETSTVCLYGVVAPSSEQISLINSKIEMYEGKIKGAELKNLIERVNTLNVRETFPTDLIINDSSNAGITLVNRQYSGDNIVDSNLYKISLDYDENDGYITNVNVSDFNAKIIQYNNGKEISICDEIYELDRYIYELKPLDGDEMVDLILLKDVEIQYNDFISIEIQLSEKGYCYYKDKEKNISSLAKMPEGLYEFVINALEK